MIFLAVSTNPYYTNEQNLHLPNFDKDSGTSLGAFSDSCAEEDLRALPRLARSMRFTKVAFEVRGGGRRPVKSSTIFPNSALVLGATT